MALPCHGAGRSFATQVGWGAPEGGAARASRTLLPLCRLVTDSLFLSPMMRGSVMFLKAMSTRFVTVSTTGRSLVALGNLNRGLTSTTCVCVCVCDTRG